MLCDFCQEREAAFYIEQTGMNNAKRTVHLCLECAEERGVSPDPISIGKSVGALFAELATILKKAKEADSHECPVCGTSLLSIKRTMRVGCPECYAIFKNDITDLLKKQGVTSTYNGTMPQRLRHFKSVLTDRIQIQTKLEESLRKEDYEKAAIYRDYLKALEKQPVAGGNDSDD